MHTITETRRDLSQIDNFSPNVLNNLNTSAQSRGGGDGVPLNSTQSMIPFIGQQPTNSPSCRNTSNFFQAERNDSVHHLWRQHTHSCINQRNNSACANNQLLPTSLPQQSQAQYQQQNCGVVNHFGSLEQTQQLYSNLPETNAAYNRQTQLLNNTLHIEQNRRNYVPTADNHNLLQQQPATGDQTVLLNYTSNNLSPYPNSIGGNINSAVPPYLTVPQPYNYQNISTPVNHNNNINNTSTQQQPNQISPSNYPIHPPLPSPQLVFGPPPRENRRPSMNQLDESLNRTIAATFPEVFNTAANSTYFHETSQSIPINSLFQSFSNLKIPEQVALNRLAMSSQGNNSTFANKSQILKTNIEHQCIKNAVNECNNTQFTTPIPQKSFMLPPTTDRNGHVFPDCITDETNQIYSARSNMKLKFSKNVVNIPKKIEKNDSDQSPSKESLKTCTSDLFVSNSTKQASHQYSEDILNCQIRDCKTNYSSNNNKENTHNTNCQTASLDNHETRHNSPFVLHEESAFIDMVVEGCIHGEEIATKYQNVPCFKNIKKLCEKTKTDLMTPHCTARNIHSQGIPWATKDYIFAFTRLTSCWYLLKGYLGQKSDVFDKIEQLYSPDLRRSFELWEQTTVNLAFHVMKSFIALGNNSSVKWNPNAHSTPLTTKDTLIRKKLVTAFPSLISINLDDTKNKSELHILARNNSGVTTQNNDDNSVEYFNNTNRMMKYFHNHHIIKPMSVRYDFDSGDEDSSKKYIKPGSYSVPQIHNQNTLNSSTISPRQAIFNDLENVGSSTSGNQKKMPPIIILSHRNDQAQQTIDAATSTMKHDLSTHQNSIEYIPFKKTPQGIITSALMKKSRCEDLQKAPDLNENKYSAQSKMLFDALKITKSMDNQQNDSNDVSKNNINLTVEHCVEVDDKQSQVNDGNTCKDDVKKRNNTSSNVSEYNSTSSTSTSSPNKNYGTKKHCRKSESKSSIRKGVFVKTNKSRRSDQHSTSDYQTKSTCIKKAHKSYYNTILSSPKYLDENCNIKFRTKCHQNVKWNIWYSRKHDGLSHLAIQTFERILLELWNMPSSHYFVFEVDVRDIPDYYEIIKHPMFLTNILQKLKQYKYNNLNQVVYDFRRIFRNARIFLEVHPDKRLQRLIGHFSNVFEQLLNDNFPKMDFSTIVGEDNEVLPGTNLLSKNKLSRSSTPLKSDDNVTSPSSQEDR